MFIGGSFFVIMGCIMIHNWAFSRGEKIEQKLVALEQRRDAILRNGKVA